MNNLALLILDFQDAFLRRIPKSEEFLNRCCFAIEAANLLGLRIIYTEQSPEKLGSTDKSLVNVGLSGATCFAKKTFSAFGAPGLVDYLKGNGIEHLMIAGLETSICVYQTIMDALRNDFDVTILSDCISGRREDDSRAIIASLQNSPCHRLPCETIFYSLLQTAEHPQFKAFNDIVKKYS